MTAHEHVDCLSDILLERLGLFKGGIMGRIQVDQPVGPGLNAVESRPIGVSGTNSVSRSRSELQLLYPL